MRVVSGKNVMGYQTAMARGRTCCGSREEGEVSVDRVGQRRLGTNSGS